VLKTCLCFHVYSSLEIKVPCMKAWKTKLLGASFFIEHQDKIDLAYKVWFKALSWYVR
jgi:hypothetical protein